MSRNAFITALMLMLATLFFWTACDPQRNAATRALMWYVSMNSLVPYPTVNLVGFGLLFGGLGVMHLREPRR